jgi:adenosine deaminase
VDQYRLARDVHGLDDAALAALARSSLLGSRAPLALRDRALADVDAWLAAPPTS